MGEWTTEWFGGIDSSLTGNWGTGYNADITIGLASSEYVSGTGIAAPNLPGAALRGGYYNGGLGAGIFFLNVAQTPTSGVADAADGFRCVIPR